MTPEHTEYLIKTYPKLYAHFHAFECLDGWFDLIDRLSAKLESECDEDRFATQVKEKYGTLRFYMSTLSLEQDEAIEDAEIESEKTCEVCGKPGKYIMDRSWHYIRCEDCRKEKKSWTEII